MKRRNKENILISFVVLLIECGNRQQYNLDINKYNKIKFNQINNDTMQLIIFLLDYIAFLILF